jgi:hypothetical protein
VDGRGAALNLWSGGPVQKIIKTPASWILQSGEGIVISEDLSRWNSLNSGLPVKTIKLFNEGKKTFAPMVQEIKDMEVDSKNPDIMVCATKDQIFLSRDGGKSWNRLGMPPYRTNGIKAVAAAYMPSASVPSASMPRLTVFVSHSTYGLFYITPDVPGAQWTELNEGLEKMETTDNADEVSDIAVVYGAQSVSVYVSQTFRRNVYSLDWDNKRFNLHWAGAPGFGTVDSLSPGKTGLRFLGEGLIGEIAYEPEIFRRRDDLRDTIRGISRNQKITPLCVLLREGTGYVSLSELWLLDEAGDRTGAASAPALSSPSPAGREGLYLPVNHAMNPVLLKPYLDVISGRGLNMIVIDMKDDYGRLRFTPKNPEIPKKGRVFRPLDIDTFLRDMKERGIYTVARIVVFKDPELAAKDGGKYAVWDASSNKPWAGYFDTRRKKSPPDEKRTDRETILPADDPGYEILRTFYDEQWVDPYSEEVWEYTAALAAELHERGFDEIQFDYIRFPTDGVNLRDASYRWQDPGMDMESAILSFLRHIRARVAAPISIDIYGANGWYRTGARTGQEVELLAPWVDVICPMYYPSHFEQDFLAQEPAELRPYRIYYQGTLRTARIGRGRVIVRPYVQAFYLNVSYDRAYYDADYVRRETEGTRDAGNGGLTYWNNSGRYDDIPN